MLYENRQLKMRYYQMKNDAEHIQDECDLHKEEIENILSVKDGNKVKKRKYTVDLIQSGSFWLQSCLRKERNISYI
jgi:hypothetical protein